MQKLFQTLALLVELLVLVEDIYIKLRQNMKANGKEIFRRHIRGVGVVENHKDLVAPLLFHDGKFFKGGGDTLNAVAAADAHFHAQVVGALVEHELVILHAETVAPGEAAAVEHLAKLCLVLLHIETLALQ